MLGHRCVNQRHFFPQPQPQRLMIKFFAHNFPKPSKWTLSSLNASTTLYVPLVKTSPLSKKWIASNIITLALGLDKTWLPSVSSKGISPYSQVKPLLFFQKRINFSRLNIFRDTLLYFSIPIFKFRDISQSKIWIKFNFYTHIYLLTNV